MDLAVEYLEFATNTGRTLNGYWESLDKEDFQKFDNFQDPNNKNQLIVIMRVGCPDCCWNNWELFRFDKWNSKKYERLSESHLDDLYEDLYGESCHF